jgi:hypothetical protein
VIGKEGKGRERKGRERKGREGKRKTLCGIKDCLYCADQEEFLSVFKEFERVKEDL